jgi:very-short-patch-repair endonuclease
MAVLRGRLVRVRRGFYAEGSGPDVTAATAAYRLGAVISHASAAALWGVDVLGRSDPAVHVTRPRRCQGATRAYPDTVLHHAGLPTEHVTDRDGIPVTTPARTVIDLARSQPFRAGVVAADSALRRRLCTRDELREVLHSCRSWPGTRTARRVVAFADRRSASPLESISRVAFHDHRLPAPILQALIGGLDEVDFLWERYRVIGEADGLMKYTDPQVLRKEKLREEGLAQLGFTVFRWTWRDAYERPDALAHRAGVILRRRGWRP